jgi:hypothetical protein
MGNLRELSGLLRRIHARYNQPSPKPIGLYLTRFGYETKPADPTGVSLAQQAEYLDHAEYLAWHNRAVRTLAQFLLVDAKPPVATTFQSGLRTTTGARKPAYDAYALPVWLPSRSAAAGRRLEVWGLVRAAPNGRRVQVSIQVRRGAGHPWRRVALRPTIALRGYVSTSVRVRRSGQLRLVWNGHHSRAAPFRVR